MLFFKVVFEKELDLTNVPETLKDELKQVQSVEVDEFLMKLKLMNLIIMIIRGPKSQNFPDGKILCAKTFRMRCVNRFCDK